VIGFAGLSHLGIVSAVAVAAKGFEVVGYDLDSSRIEDLNKGKLPVVEPELDDLFSANRPRLQFTSDPGELSSCSVIYFSLDVSTDENGRSDLSLLLELVDAVLVIAASGTTLVILSQVPPGFTRTLRSRAASADFEILYQVETLIFGRAVERAMNPERFIVGAHDPKSQLPAPYARLLSAFGCPVLPMRYESAELAKISINMCLVSSVSVANTMAELCERLGADWSEIVPALKLDKRIGPQAYLSPGLGIAGGNLERDLATVVGLANEYGSDDNIVDAWISNSRYRRDWVLRTLHEQLAVNDGTGPLIAIWGLTYKQDTNSTKNSPAVSLIRALAPYQIRAYDPAALITGDLGPQCTRTQSATAACKGADLLAVMTPWAEFSSYQIDEIRDLMRGRVIIDPYGMMNGDACVSAGFSYFRLGTPARTIQ
jgi:UDPglucose 6-dehydrogenase